MNESDDEDARSDRSGVRSGYVSEEEYGGDSDNSMIRLAHGSSVFLS